MTEEERRIYDKEKEIIAEVVETAINRKAFPCEKQSAQIAQIETDITRLTILLTGNGTPANGMIYKVMSMDEIIKKSADREIRNEGRWWALFIMMAGLIMTTIWGIIIK